jgi:predicted metal-dependent phosphotriesterase family hydrolase
LKVKKLAQAQDLDSAFDGQLTGKGLSRADLPGYVAEIGNSQQFQQTQRQLQQAAADAQKKADAAQLQTSQQISDWLRPL